MTGTGLPSGRLRIAVTDDVESLGRMDAYVQQLHYEAHPAVWKVPNVETSIAFFESQSATEDTTIVVSQDDHGEAVGYVLFHIVDKPESSHKPARRLLDLEHLAVDPPHQREGRARELLECVDRYAIDNSCQSMELSVWRFNDRAISVYEKQGYVDISRKMVKRVPK